MHEWGGVLDNKEKQGVVLTLEVDPKIQILIITISVCMVIVPEIRGNDEKLLRHLLEQHLEIKQALSLHLLISLSRMCEIIA